MGHPVCCFMLIALTNIVAISWLMTLLLLPCVTWSPVNTEDTSTALMSTQHTKYCDDIVSATAAFVMSTEINTNQCFYLLYDEWVLNLYIVLYSNIDCYYVCPLFCNWANVIPPCTNANTDHGHCQHWPLPWWHDKN